MGYEFKLKTRDKVEKPIRCSEGEHSTCPECYTHFMGKKCPRCGLHIKKHKKHRRVREDREAA
jgi:hypothetical protein